MESALFAIRDGDGQTRPVEGFADVLDELAFRFVEPALPSGASFSMVTAVLPPSVVEERDARERLTALELSAATVNRTGLFMLSASIAGTTPGGGETTTVGVGEVEGELLDDGNTAALGWRSCDVGYLLAYDPKVLAREDAIAVAASIDEGC